MHTVGGLSAVADGSPSSRESHGLRFPLRRPTPPQNVSTRKAMRLPTLPAQENLYPCPGAGLFVEFFEGGADCLRGLGANKVKRNHRAKNCTPLGVLGGRGIHFFRAFRFNFFERSLRFAEAFEFLPELAGGPLKPDFGLSGVVRRQHRAFPLLARVCVPSIRTRFQLAPRSQSRDGESCSTANLRGVHTVPASPDCNECSGASLQTAHDCEH